MKVAVHRVAAADLKLAVAWYQLERRGLGQELRQSIRQALDGIKVHPERWPLYHNSVRRALVDRFPYIVYYGIVADTIQVFRIIHASRDPLPVKELLP